MKLPIAVFVISMLVSVSAAFAQSPKFPAPTLAESQLRMQLGEALYRLGATETQLEAAIRERDALKAKPSPSDKVESPAEGQNVK